MPRKIIGYVVMGKVPSGFSFILRTEEKGSSIWMEGPAVQFKTEAAAQAVIDKIFLADWTYNIVPVATEGL